MDARITKQRLGVLLSYDWLKILGVIAAAVLGFYVLFSMITTRPTVAQVYTVFTYGGLSVGGDSPYLTDDLDGKFSYDILEVEMQNFDEGALGEQALTARRGVLEGDAVIVANYAEGEEITPFEQLCAGNTVKRGTPEEGVGFYAIPAFFEETEEYLRGYFGDDLSKEEPDAAEISRSFYRHNGSDKRFKTDAQKETGISLERERILSIRDNYLFVRGAVDGGLLPVVSYESEGYDTADGHVDRSYAVGLSLAKLTGLGDLFFYYNEGGKSTEQLVLLFYDNGYRVADAKYENYALVRYLLETYEPAHS